MQSLLSRINMLFQAAKTELQTLSRQVNEKSQEINNLQREKSKLESNIKDLQVLLRISSTITIHFWTFDFGKYRQSSRQWVSISLGSFDMLTRLKPVADGNLSDQVAVLQHDNLKKSLEIQRLERELQVRLLN